jgi:putative ABC transport system permease protein
VPVLKQIDNKYIKNRKEINMKQFFITLIRNIRRNPLISIINFWGLILGFVCVIFIVLWTKSELSYDRFHKNSKNIYRVHRYFYDSNGAENLHLPYVAPVIAPLLRNEFPEIQNIARIYHTDMIFSSGDQKFAENNVCFAEPDVLKIFDFEGLPTDSSLLSAPFTVIISDEAADKFFHKPDATGDKLEFKDDNGKKYALQVIGVFKKWKGNSHFNPDFFISFSTMESLVDKDEFTNWGSNNYETFALIPALGSGIDKKLDNFIDKNYKFGSKATKIRLEGLTDIHFNWYGNRSYIYILISIAFLILIIGSINYMNLNAAVYFKQLKEIRIKKIIGASQRSLGLQLLAESVLFCFMGLIIAVYLASILSHVIKISDNPIIFRIRDNLSLILGFVALSFLTGVLSGIYPVLILSSYKPVTANDSENIKTRRTFFRNGLVVFQFVVSSGLIISFLLVSRQLNYINSLELGFDKENIIIIPATPKLIDKLDVFRQQLTQDPDILGVTASKRVPSEGLLDSNGANIISDGAITPLGFRLANVRIDREFIPTYKIRILAGRNFNENISADSGYILNESAIKKIGWTSPDEAIGRSIIYGGRKGNIIGIVKDFHYESLHNQISPVIMYYDPSSFNRVSIRVIPSDIKRTLAFIEKTWMDYNVSDNPFSFEYLNDRFNRLYTSEEKMRTIFSYFMIVAISISVLGMAGLSLFLIERRTKEIGIRKINGATVLKVILMLNKNFVKWVALALMIAVPITYYAMHRWLENFAYKTEISFWIFVLAGIFALTIALLTVSWQSWRAATRNPVDALRYE